MALTTTPFPEFGLPCPDFTLPGVDGKSHSLESYKNGKPLVIMFICNHCPYVQAIEDRLVQLGKTLQEKQVHLIAINSNDVIAHPEDSLPEMIKRSQAKGYSFDYLFDEDQNVARAFGAVCTPDFFVYDSQLKLSYRGRLDDSWRDPSKVTRQELLLAVNDLLQNLPAPQKQTPSMGCSIKWK